MELKKLYLSVDLVGYWRNSFDGRLLFTTAENIIPTDSTDYDTCEAYIFHIMNENKNLTQDTIAISFRQSGEDIILGYSKYRFTITSINRQAISFKDELSSYRFERIV